MPTSISSGLVYGSEKREAAFDYMVWLLHEGRLGKFVRRIPAWIPEIEPFINDAFQGYSNPRISVAQDALATAVPQWNVGSLPTGGQVTTLLNDIGDKKLWTGEQDAATFLKEIQPTFASHRGRGRRDHPREARQLAVNRLWR